jgi:hypothetical protein
MPRTTSPVVPISWGELLDKITILEIKRARLSGLEAREHIDREYRLLGAVGAAAFAHTGVEPLVDALRRVNETLWNIEDAIREEDARARFGEKFIQLAQSVYRHNDERAAIKRQINVLLQSELVEEKSYASFTSAGASRS